MLQVMSAMSRHAGTDPTMLSWLSRASSEIITLKCVQHVVVNTPISAGLLDKAERFVRQLPPLPELKYYVGAEPILGRIPLSPAREKEITSFMRLTPDQETLLTKHFIKGFLRQRELRRWITLWRFLPRDEASFAKSHKKICATEDESAAERSLIGSLYTATNRDYRFLSGAYGFVIAWRRVNLAGIRLLREGPLFPEQLPRCPESIDPFFEEPFQYHKSPTSFWVASREIPTNDLPISFQYNIPTSS